MRWMGSLQGRRGRCVLAGAVLGLVGGAVFGTGAALAEEERSHEARRAYLVVDGLYTSVPALEIKADNFGTIDIESENAWGMGFRMGYMATSDIRLEGDFDFWTNSVTDVKIDGADTTSEGGLYQTSFFGNIYYDLPHFGRFRPFVMGGLGVFTLGFDNLSAGTASGSHTMSIDGAAQSALAYQAGAGLSVLLTPRLVLDSDYRYRGTGEIEFDTSLGTAKIDSVNTHNYRMGLRLHF